MVEPTKLLKQFAKKTELSTKQVKAIWEQHKAKLIAEGKNEKHPLFIQELASNVKEQLGIEEKHIYLDKFKNFL